MPHHPNQLAALQTRPPWAPGTSGNPGGKPKAKPLTEKLKWRLEEILRPDTELAATIQQSLGAHWDKETGTFIPKPIPRPWFGRTVADLLALVEVASALAGDSAAMTRLWDRIEGKVADSSGLTMLVQINSPVFGQDGLMAEPADQLGQFGDDGRIAITVDVAADETVVSEPTSTPE